MREIEREIARDSGIQPASPLSQQSVTLCSSHRAHSASKVTFVAVSESNLLLVLSPMASSSVRSLWTLEEWEARESELKVAVENAKAVNVGVLAAVKSLAQHSTEKPTTMEKLDEDTEQSEKPNAKKQKCEPVGSVPVWSGGGEDQTLICGNAWMYERGVGIVTVALKDLPDKIAAGLVVCRPRKIHRRIPPKMDDDDKKDANQKECEEIQRWVETRIDMLPLFDKNKKVTWFYFDKEPPFIEKYGCRIGARWWQLDGNPNADFYGTLNFIEKEIEMKKYDDEYLNELLFDFCRIWMLYSCLWDAAECETAADKVKMAWPQPKCNYSEDDLIYTKSWFSTYVDLVHKHRLLLLNGKRVEWGIVRAM